MKSRAQAEAIAGVRTPTEVRAAFKQHGVSVSKWAASNNFDPSLVRDVLLGRVKGDYGKAHEIAVALGLKAAPGKPPSFLAAAKQQTKAA